MNVSGKTDFESIVKFIETGEQEEDEEEVEEEDFDDEEFDKELDFDEHEEEGEIGEGLIEESKINLDTHDELWVGMCSN